MKFLLLVCAALLLTCACALAEPRLIWCEYFEGAGMEDASLCLTMERQEKGADRLTVEDRKGSDTAVTEWNGCAGALDDLHAYLLAACPPEAWADLPDSEFFPLDAPIRTVSLLYDDGSSFDLISTKELPAGCDPILWNVRRFLESYAAADAGTYAWSWSSFGGGGMRVTPVLSDPVMAYWTSSIEYDTRDEPVPPGSAYRETFVFHGRIPGRVQVTMQESGPLTPVPVPGQDIHPTVLILEIDGDFNVTRVDPDEE